MDWRVQELQRAGVKQSTENKEQTKVDVKQRVRK
jgi:hypothetical protein